MKDEELAEEYLQSIEGDDCVIITDREERKQAFLAGLKANFDLTIEGRDVKIKELKKENEELRKTETMLKVLKDRGVIKSWYYNGSYHIGNELPR